MRTFYESTVQCYDIVTLFLKKSKYVQLWNLNFFFMIQARLANWEITQYVTILICSSLWRRKKHVILRFEHTSLEHAILIIIDETIYYVPLWSKCNNMSRVLFMDTVVLWSIPMIFHEDDVQDIKCTINIIGIYEKPFRVWYFSKQSLPKYEAASLDTVSFLPSTVHPYNIWIFHIVQFHFSQSAPSISLEDGSINIYMSVSLHSIFILVP